MNFGQNLYTWFLNQAQPLVLIGMIAMGVYFIFKREFTKVLTVAIVAVVAVLLVFNAGGVKDVLLSLGNRIIGG